MNSRLPTGRSVVKVRDLGRSGVAETNHTSFRLSYQDRDRLRKLAAKRYGGVTMSAVLRILIRDAAEREGIEVR